MYKIKRGLDLPITGRPELGLGEKIIAQDVGLLAIEDPGLKPTMMVAEGDRVKAGQKLFENKKNPGVYYTSPQSGVVKSIQRGEKRAFVSIHIETNNDEPLTFGSCPMKKAEVKAQLLESGLWTSLRARPFAKVPKVDCEPEAIFVTAMDSDPLAFDPVQVINHHWDDFTVGLSALKLLTEGKVYLCCSPEFDQQVPKGIQKEVLYGPHPSWLVGTHIHMLHPVSVGHYVFYVGYQEVIAIGMLIGKGVFWQERYVGIVGPMVKKPRVYRVSLGADVQKLVEGKLKEDSGRELRVVTGSIFSGRKVDEVHRFLGRFDRLICVLAENHDRIFLGWQRPGFDQFSVKRVFASALFTNYRYDFTTTTGGSDRAMVPVESFEQVMPFDTEPTFLLRSLLVGDSDRVVELGALDLAEEDLGLSSFVCPGKESYGPLLRNILNIVEKDG